MTHRSYKHSYECWQICRTPMEPWTTEPTSHLRHTAQHTIHSLLWRNLLLFRFRLRISHARICLEYACTCTNPARVPTVLSEEYVRAFVRTGQLLNENRITRSHLTRAKRIYILDHYYIAKLPIFNVQTKFKSLSYRINYC